MRPGLAPLLLLLAACASPGSAGPSPAEDAARCPPRGGNLAIASAATGEVHACEPVVVARGEERLFAGETDARGLVPADVSPGDVLQVRLGGAEQRGEVRAPFGEGALLVELGEPGSRLRVLGEGERPLPGLAVELRQGDRTVFAGTTSPLGVLARAPRDLSGLVAVAPGLSPAAVDGERRTVLLLPAAPAE